MTDWQPIESAPRDGTEFEVKSGGSGKWPRIAKWCHMPGERSYLGLDEPQLGVPTHWRPIGKRAA